MIYKSPKSLTFVIYEDQRPAQCFEIKKNQLKFLTFAIPILLVVFIFLFLVYISYFKYHDETRPSQISSLPAPSSTEKNLSAEKAQLAQLLEKQQELEEINKTLMKKIQSSSETTSILPLFRPILGFEDLSDKSPLMIREVKTDKSSQQVSLSFDLVNNDPNQKKTSGYIYVLMKSGNQISLYPNISYNVKDPYLASFDGGETFTVTRFRPVVAKFSISTAENIPLFFKIFLFSKTGDLLFQKSIGPID